MYDTLTEIVEQLEYCEYTTKDKLHDLKDNAALIKLKELAKIGSIPVEPEVDVVLAEVLSLIEDNILVRNIEDDDDIMKFLKQGTRLTNTLYKAKEYLDSKHLD